MHDFRNIPVSRVLSFGPFMLDPARRRLETDGVPRRLCERAMDVLLTLISRPLEVVSTQELMAAVWPFQPEDAGRLRNYIDVLVKALSDGAGTGYIADVAGRGFSFMAPVGIAGINVSHSGMPSGDWIANVRLDDREQMLLGCLLGMTRTFSLPDALIATLGTGLGPAELPAILAQLVTKSLIVEPMGGRTPIYRIADIVRACLDDGLSAGIGHEPQLWRLSP